MIFSTLPSLILTGLCLFGDASAQSRTNKDGRRPQFRSITRDVCVIGGGSGGTYAAVRLRQMGKSVAIVEKAGELGGHTNTYEDPATGATYDYGVQVFVDRPVVRDYFATLDVPLQTFLFSSLGTSERIDFTTGERVELADQDPSAGLQRYAAQLAKYPFLFPGFDLPDPIPEDLLLPFRDFATKYELGGAAVRVIASVCQGVGEFLDTLTIYIMKYFDLGVLQGSTNGFLQSANNNNSALYRNAEALFGSDVFLDSQIVAVRRPRVASSRNPNLIIVKNPSGFTVIRAEKIVVAFPQLIDKLDSFDLDRKEREVFSRFDNSAYYTTLLKNTNLPEGLSILAAGADEQFNTPAIPGPNSFNPTGITGLFNLFYTTEKGLPDDQVKQSITADILRLQNSGFDPTEPEFEVFEAHVPFQLVVSAEEIAGGFYNRLNSLQGYRKTYYTGAALSAHASSTVWQFTEMILPQIVD